MWILSTSNTQSVQHSVYSASLSKLPDTKADNWDDWCGYSFMGLCLCWAPIGLYCLVFTRTLFWFPFSNLSWCLWTSDTVGDSETIEVHCLDFLLLPNLLRYTPLSLPWLPESDIVLLSEPWSVRGALCSLFPLKSCSLSVYHFLPFVINSWNGKMTFFYLLILHRLLPTAIQFPPLYGLPCVTSSWHLASLLRYLSWESQPWRLPSSSCSS